MARHRISSSTSHKLHHALSALPAHLAASCRLCRISKLGLQLWRVKVSRPRPMMLQHACAAAQHAGKGCRDRCTMQMIWKYSSAHFKKYDTLHMCHRNKFYSSTRCTQRSDAAMSPNCTEATTVEVSQHCSSIQSYGSLPCRTQPPYFGLRRLWLRSRCGRGQPGERSGSGR